MSKFWHTRIDDVELGPISSKELIRLSRSGDLSVSDMVRLDGSDRWVAASSIKGLPFGGHSPGNSIAKAYNDVVNSIVDALVGPTVSDASRGLAIKFLESTSCDIRVCESINTGDANLCRDTIVIAVGHDLLYWSIVAILADGVVDAEELDAIDALLAEIASAFAKHFEPYSRFESLAAADREKFLATFKREKKHYSWPTKSNPTNVSTDVFVGAYIAIASNIACPQSETLLQYTKLIDSTLSLIVMVGGTELDEEAVLAKAAKYCGTLKEQFLNATTERRPDSPLLEGAIAKSKSPTEAGNFRNANWGISKEAVLASETGKVISESPGVAATTTVAGNDALVIYTFASGMLVRGVILFQETYSNENNYLNDFYEIKELLTKKYGPPKGGNDKSSFIWRNDLYSDDSDRWGFAVSIGHIVLQNVWETSETDIILNLSGDNYQIQHRVQYTSTKLGHLESQAVERQNLADL